MEKKLTAMPVLLVNNTFMAFDVAMSFCKNIIDNFTKSPVHINDSCSSVTPLKTNYSYLINISPDVDKIKKELKENDGYCPCKIQRMPENKCICEEFRNMDSEGICHCGLYYKVKKIN